MPFTSSALQGVGQCPAHSRSPVATVGRVAIYFEPFAEGRFAAAHGPVLGGVAAGPSFMGWQPSLRGSVRRALCACEIWGRRESVTQQLLELDRNPNNRLFKKPPRARTQQGSPVLALPSRKPEVGFVPVDALGTRGWAQHWQVPKSSSGKAPRL